MSINSLPNDVLLCIIGSTRSNTHGTETILILSTVCRRWYALLRSPSFIWANLQTDFNRLCSSGDSAVSQERFLAWLRPRSPAVRTLWEYPLPLSNPFAARVLGVLHDSLQSLRCEALFGEGAVICPPLVAVILPLLCLQHLKMLSISFTSLLSLPAEGPRCLWLPEPLARLSTLEGLTLMYEGPIVVPGWLRFLSRLSELAIHGARGIRMLSGWTPPRLRVLDLIECLIAPQSADEWCPGLADLKALKRLCFSDCIGLTALPESVSRLSVLESLVLAQHHVRERPVDLPRLNGAQLDTLRSLCLSGQGLTDAHNVFGLVTTLRNLQNLYLHNNILTGVPRDGSLQCLTALQELSLGGMTDPHLDDDSVVFDLTGLGGCQAFTGLRALEIYDCPFMFAPEFVRLAELPGFSEFKLSDAYPADVVGVVQFAGMLLKWKQQGRMGVMDIVLDAPFGDELAEYGIHNLSHLGHSPYALFHGVLTGLGYSTASV